MAKKQVLTDGQILKLYRLVGYDDISQDITGILMLFSHPVYGTISHSSYKSAETYIRNIITCNPGYFPEAEEALVKMLSRIRTKKTSMRTVVKKVKIA